MPKIKFFLITLIAIIAFIIGAGVFFVKIKNSIYNNFGQRGAKKTFVIESGEGAKNIGDRLEKEGLISSAFGFQIYVWQKNAGSKIKAGEYEIETGQNIPAIAEILVNGQIRSNDIWITIPEGFNLQQIAAKVQSSKFKVQIEPDIENIINNSSQKIKRDYWFLADDRVKTLEGFLFPDTYKFSEDASAEDVVKKMLDNFSKKIAPLQNEIEAENKNIYDIITLASIVEKEVVSQEDMKIAAGIFLHRLEIGMLLQSDATVNYITQKGDPSPSYKDLETDSPYNTYKHAGLPPGPICNPGIKAIEAVLEPERTDYLYFLTPSGQPTVYSKTLEEHEMNKRKWLK